MKKTTFYVIATAALATLTGNVIAQTGVGINTSGAAAADCAVLDVSSTTLGELIPRVALTTGTTTYGLSGTSTNANSMLVYNTATVVNATPSLSLYPGFYYWSTASTKWIPLVSGTSGWLLNGNYGTTATPVPTTYGTTTLGITGNWLGTADGQSLVIGTNNIERMRILSGGNVGIGTAAPTSLFHVLDSAGTFANSQLVTIAANKMTGGIALYIPSNSLTTGNLMYLNCTNTAATGPALLIRNKGTSANGILSIGGGAVNYSSIFAQTTAAAAGTGVAVTTSTHAIYGSMQGGQAYSFGVYGEVLTAASNIAGVIGYYSSNDYGMLGYYDGTKEYGVYGSGTNFGLYGSVIATAGGNYDNTAYAGVFGEGGNANYNFGVEGWDQGSTTRTGGVFGAYSTNYWGSLGYRSSAPTDYGLYYNGGSATGTGYMPDATITGIGQGGWGGIIGSWTRGQVMGSVSCGELFASYNLGNAYTSGYSAEVVTVKDKRVAAYSVTSTDVKVYNDGTGKLSGGKAHVQFDENFVQLIGENKPVVTVSPMGQCNGVYITNVNSKGFDIVEQNNGNSDVEFSYIVVGKRLDAENKPSLPDALAKKDFDEKMKGVMNDETNKEQIGTPVWWDGKQVRFDTPPEENKKEYKRPKIESTRIAPPK
ncbi:MAG TPA: hypothetical protein VK783_02110 [Bacteroidia bacterium]|jgi:hypothetical protein|nr:hypothetical protein [Bacteroidia bacterium]